MMRMKEEKVINNSELLEELKELGYCLEKAFKLHVNGYFTDSLDYIEEATEHYKKIKVMVKGKRVKLKLEGKE